MKKTLKMINDTMDEHQKVLQKTIQECQPHIYTACVIITDTLEQGNKVLLFGNGGSASDAQHIAAEITGRFERKRRGLPAIALSTDTSALTAIGNDFGFDRIYDRQVEALAKKGDLCIGFSTSGTSKNVLRALSLGKQMQCRTIALSGKGGGVMGEFADVNIIIPSDNTARIQEMHIMIGHIMAKAIDEKNQSQDG